jgi:hypothetical protein
MSALAISSGLFVVNYHFFVAPRTEQGEPIKNCGAGYDFRLGLSATLWAENESAVIRIQWLPPLCWKQLHDVCTFNTALFTAHSSLSEPQ